MLSFRELAESFHSSIQQAEALGLKGEELSAKALELFQFQCGGLVFYIPKWKSNQSSCRDKAITEDFNGRNHAELARKYGLSIQKIYDVIRKDKMSKGKEKA